MIDEMRFWIAKRIKREGILWKILRVIHRIIKRIRGEINIIATYFQTLSKGNKYLALTKDVDKYCSFLAYPRSGHSLIGSLLDAHENIVMAHEMPALEYIKYKFNKAQFLAAIFTNTERFSKKGRVNTGYSYEVPNQHQGGRYTKLEVIGNKGAFNMGPYKKTSKQVKRLQEITRYKLRIMHAVRNPFDNIATMARGGNENLMEADSKMLDKYIKEYFLYVRRNMIWTRKLSDKTLILVRHEDVIKNPKKELKRMIQFLGLKADKKYLDDCASIIFKKPHKSREKVPWTPEQIKYVEDMCKKFPFIKGYKFDN